MLFRKLSVIPSKVVSIDSYRNRQHTAIQWTRSETIALAKQSCTICFGIGLRPDREGEDLPCNCVFRAIFRACFARFQKCSRDEGRLPAVHLERTPGKQGKNSYSFKNQEYVADFVLLSRRVLGADSLAHKIFKYHFLLGADWKLCCRKLGMSRGNFFHEVYRIEQRLGRAYREVQPYALYPLDEYFGGRVKSARTDFLSELLRQPAA